LFAATVSRAGLNLLAVFREVDVADGLNGPVCSRGRLQEIWQLGQIDVGEGPDVKTCHHFKQLPGKNADTAETMIVSAPDGGS
jgi:hypothetical protein